MVISEAAINSTSLEKTFLKTFVNSQQNTWGVVFFCQHFISKETYAQLLFCEVFKIFQNNFFGEQFRMAASVIQWNTS